MVQALPAPSLRELSSEARLRECTPMNGKRKRFLSFVGAMKIARNLAVSGRHIEWHPPLPGSLPEGAVERSETEGVYYDEW